MALAILEHWFLVLPLPAAALWNWSLRSRGSTQPCDVEIAAGFLGAGKTTFLRRRLAEADPKVRTVALVNDFGELGVDAALLRGRGADVVELPNGCICCSLKADLAEQLKTAVKRWAPQRVLIEPSGVADVASLLRVLHQPDLQPLVKNLQLFSVIDSGAFLRDYARMPQYFEIQANLSPVFILNKTDLTSPIELQTIEQTLHLLNPAAQIVPASYGIMEPASVKKAQPAAWQPRAVAEDEDAVPPRHDHAGEEVGPGLQSWSASLEGQCDPDELKGVLEAVAKGAFGQVDRVKGIARSGAGWIHFDVASGRSSMAAFAPQQKEEARVVAIGRLVDERGLSSAFAGCAVPAPA